ncbi:MAG TPA: phenylalanine--tRNA ligase subunit beta [Pyrinomonadaceae bacterium]|jgi:phenylalanyl-tRNA synthetase beta chain|nr:phenylalanine--tRNA ligase subunit beta [Pyrinomonadaceae bacterium]
MNISYNWLRELTGTEMSPSELRDHLTMVGLAVDGVSEAEDDFVLDFDITSNRPDCLSHLGVARELATIEAGSVRMPEGAPPGATAGMAESFTSVEIREPELCPRYAARVVRGVKIGPSPDWLVKRLEAIGQRSINNVADITNYVMHELGQPLHAFDLSKLAEQRIVVRRALGGEKLITLDGVERELDAEMLVIADAERAVAIAGVMGGEETEISAATNEVLIESAYFDPASVRRTARQLGLHTEASHRFERGADYGGVLQAQERCVALICEIAGGTATENAIDAYPNYIQARDVSLRPERVTALTGLTVATTEIRRILSALGFAQRARLSAFEDEWSFRDGVPEEVAAGDLNPRLTYVVPSWRVDVEREEDLVEEVARHVGYEKIATELPASNIAGEHQPGERRRRAMRQILTAYGFDEAISLSFIDTSYDDLFELVPDFVSGTTEGEPRFVTVRNPIIEGAARMRPTLLPGLLDAVRNNFNHGTRNVRLFETGRIFAAEREGDRLPHEREAFALVLTGGATEENRAGAQRELDFYDLKGALEAACEAMQLPPLQFAAAGSAKHLRAGQAAGVIINGKSIGTIGRLSERVAAMYKFRQPVYVAEVDLTALLAAEEQPVLYTPLARFPSVVRDVSLLVAHEVALSELLRTVAELEVREQRSTSLVDVYEGASLPEGKRSLTLRLEYRSDERTLRDEEVDEMHARIVDALEKRFDAKMRA